MGNQATLVQFNLEKKTDCAHNGIIYFLATPSVFILLRGYQKTFVAQPWSDLKQFNLLQTKHFPLIPSSGGITRRSQPKLTLTKQNSDSFHKNQLKKINLTLTVDRLIRERI